MDPIDQAEAYLEAGTPIPIDVAAGLMARGFVVSEIERNYQPQEA